MADPVQKTGDFDAPWWIQLGIRYGLASLLVMFLLGMLDGVPGMKSPITRIADGLKEATALQTSAIHFNTQAINDLRDSIDVGRREASTDRLATLKELSAMRDDLYATRMRTK